MYRQSEKKFLSSNISPTCPQNMVNFGPLAAETRWRVWGTPANFNGFCVFAALLCSNTAKTRDATITLGIGPHF